MGYNGAADRQFAIPVAAIMGLIAACTADRPATPVAVTPSAGADGNPIAVQAYRMTNLTNSPYADGYASFSPDGTRLAFSSVRDGNRDLYLLDLQTDETERITVHPADDGGPPEWSKDGATLYFRSKRDGESYNIYQMDLATRVVKRLTDVQGGEGYVDLSPDGSSIAFHSERDQLGDDRNLEVYVLNLATSEQRRVTRQPNRRNGGPDFLPDGKSLINVARSPEASSVQITNLDGRILAEYAATQALDTYIGALSPDGKKFVFYSDREGGSIHLYLLELGDGSITRITTGPATFSSAQFSPGGRYLALQYDDGSPSDIVLLDLGAPLDSASAEIDAGIRD